MINLAMDAASKSDAKTPQMPFPECGAMSQGYIGYHLQNSIENELKRRNMDVMTAILYKRASRRNGEKRLQIQRRCR